MGIELDYDIGKNIAYVDYDPYYSEEALYNAYRLGFHNGYDEAMSRVRNVANAYVDTDEIVEKSRKKGELSYNLR